MIESPPPHMTYLHLLSVVNSEAGRFPADRPLRILDAGCGDGGLIAYLAAELPRTGLDRRVALHGFEVHGHPTNDRDAMVTRLAARFPGEPWAARCVVIDEAAPWPYPDGAFDVVVSNQVLEHVQDHDAFFRQVARVLGPDGFAVHLFPTRSVVVEPHLHLPFAHRVGRGGLRLRYIRLLSRAGLGGFRERHRATGVSLEDDARRQAEYLERHTNFQGIGDLIRVAGRHQLRGSLRYTPEYYRQKVRAVAGRAPAVRYRADRSAILDRLLALPLCRVASATLVMEKGLGPMGPG